MATNIAKKEGRGELCGLQEDPLFQDTCAILPAVKCSLSGFPEDITVCLNLNLLDGLSRDIV